MNRPNSGIGPWTIYGLVDPRTNLIRYIGQTQHHPSIRLQHHLRQKDTNTAKTQWISELRRLCTQPYVVVLEYARSQRVAFRTEIEWIRRGLEAGWPLVNSALDDYLPGEDYSPNVDLVELSPMSEPLPESEGKWVELVSKWFSHHPEALTGKARGIADLARQMAAADGRPTEWKNYKSSAYTVYHAYRSLAKDGGG